MRPKFNLLGKEHKTMWSKEAEEAQLIRVTLFDVLHAPRGLVSSKMMKLKHEALKAFNKSTYIVLVMPSVKVKFPNTLLC